MTDDTITMHVHEAAEALLKLRGEQGQITPADIAEAVQNFDLDETEEKALNLALNSPHVAGEFTDGLQALLAEIHFSVGFSIRFGQQRRRERDET